MDRIRQVVEIVEEIDKKKDERLRAKKTVNHMNTATTKTAMEITEAMQKDLREIAGEITNRIDNGSTLDRIRKDLGEKAGSIIANGIRESYLLGLHFVEGFAESTIILNPDQVMEMNNQIRTTIQSFWDQVRQIISDDENKKVQVVGAALPLESGLFQKLTEYFARTSVSMNFLSLNNSTISTFRTLSRQTSIDDLGITVTGTIDVPKLVWISERDNRVCPICEALDGKEWDADSNQIRRPVQDSHFGCRCRLLPKSGKKVYNA